MLVKNSPTVPSTRQTIFQEVSLWYLTDNFIHTRDKDAFDGGRILNNILRWIEYSLSHLHSKIVFTVGRQPDRGPTLCKQR